MILSNTIVDIPEQQKSFSDEQGELYVIYEKDIDITSLEKNSTFDLSYISEKNDRFDTHKVVDIYVDTGVVQELEEILTSHYPRAEKTLLKRIAYYHANTMCQSLRQGNSIKKVINTFVKNQGRRLENLEYAKLAQALDAVDLQVTNNKMIVSSVEAIKGMEGQNCLFILTTDLAAYLFKKKTDDNKVKNKLYVALTRSKKKLTILITVEVEDKYGRNFIEEYMSQFC